MILAVAVAGRRVARAAHGGRRGETGAEREQSDDGSQFLLHVG
jgi:hypothetical protein